MAKGYLRDLWKSHYPFFEDCGKKVYFKQMKVIGSGDKEIRLCQKWYKERQEEEK